MSDFFARLKGWIWGEDLYGLDRMENFAQPEKKPGKLSAHHEQTLGERIRRWMRHDEARVFEKVRRFTTPMFALLIILCMLLTVSQLPSFGDPDNPANNEVTKRYIEKGLEETGGVNIVGGMILDYRAFDTLGESHVLFIAVSSVLILLRNDRKRRGKDVQAPLYEPRGDLILQKGAKVQIPLILMFGIYVVLNGHLSPGGGFSGGTVMGAALILYYNAYGSERIRKWFTYRLFNRVCVTALAFYAFAKSYSFYTGANHLHSIIPLGKPGAILSSGLILPLNIAVGVIVCCTMFGFYSLFNREEI